MAERAASNAAPDDLYFLSDMHLGPGRPPGSVAHSRLESFFYDDAFERFVAHLIQTQAARGRRGVLVLGGDVFDLLVVTEVPSRTEAIEQGILVRREHRRVGLGSSARHGAWKLQRVLAGHPTFVQSLARWLLAGHRLVVVTGNHDAELYWQRVRDVLVDALLDAAEDRAPGEGTAERVLAGIAFRQWFYYEPGRVYYEHGNQYEASNCFRYNLCPELPGQRRRQDELDLPVGSLFVRYLFNKVRQSRPYAANMVSMEQYMAALARLNLVEMIMVLVRRMPFVLRALRVAHLFEHRSLRQSRAVHEARLAELAELEGLPLSALQRVQAERAMPDGMTKTRLFRSIFRPILVKTVKYAVAAVAILFVWFLVFSLIQSTPWIAEGVLGKASLTALLAALTVLAVLVGFNRVLSRLPEVPLGAPPGLDDTARVIARTVGVPYVVMGHSHWAELRKLDRDGTMFANTGTWTAMAGSWDLIWPHNRRFTLVRIWDQRLEVVRWNDLAGRIDPFHQFEPHRPRPMDVLLGDEPAEPMHVSEAASPRLADLGRRRGGPVGSGG